MNINILKNIFKLGFIALAILGLSFAAQAASLGVSSSVKIEHVPTGGENPLSSDPPSDNDPPDGPAD